MKRTCFFLGAWMTVCRLQADPFFDWVSDTYGSFDVILSGTGLGGLGWSGTITSPSGLWQLTAADLIAYPNGTSPPSGKVEIDNQGWVAFLGPLPAQFTAPGDPSPGYFSGMTISTPGGYFDFFQPVAPINDGNGLTQGYLAGLGYECDPPDATLDWFGRATISVTSIPDVNDTSTWTWTAEWKASGGSLAIVPEPTAISIAALVTALGVIRMFGKRRKSGG